MNVLEGSVRRYCGRKRKGIKMIFRQLFHSESSIYTYLMTSGQASENPNSLDEEKEMLSLSLNRDRMKIKKPPV